jgi:stage V sporulation protein SpoVS
VIRQLVAVDRNDTKAAGAIATLIGELPVETQALVVAAIESIAAIAVPATAPA